MLQPIDIAVGFLAAYHRRLDGSWSPKAIRDDLNLPWSSLNLSLGRLKSANIIRNERVNRMALAALVPVLQYLKPAEVDRSRKVHGIATGISAPIFEGHILTPEPIVWASPLGDTVGVPLEPLHPRLPNAGHRDAGVYAVLACLEAARMGRAREVRMALEFLHQLAGLPHAITA